MLKHGVNIAVLISTLASGVIFAQPAFAQDFVYAKNYGYAQQPAQPTYQAEASLTPTQTVPEPVDQQYQLPTEHDGQYYPEEAQGAASYYGTSQTSQVDDAAADSEVVNNHYYY